MSSHQIKIGFIGAGDISILHAESIAAREGVVLKGLWNIDKEMAEEKSKKFNCEIYNSAEELVNDEELDAVFVLTNLETHHQYTILALSAGKHVFVEKPVGVSIAEIEDMQRCADEHGVICMPGHNYIYEPSIQRAKKLLDENKLGKIASLYIMYNIEHPEEVAARYPGVIRQIMTHHAYINLYLTGKPVKLSAMKSVIHYETIEQEDLSMVTLQLEGGTLIHYCASFAADDHSGDPWTMMVKLIGTDGATRYSYRDWIQNKPGIVHSHTFSAYQETITNVGQYFINECVRKGIQPLSTMQNAIEAQQIIEAIESSIAEERHIYIK